MSFDFVIVQLVIIPVCFAIGQLLSALMTMH